MSLLPFFEWMENLPISLAIKNSVWIYPFDQSVHLIALAVFAGAVVIVDLRLLGRGLTRQPLAQVARDAQPWLVGGFLMLVLTGVPQLMSNATKEYYSPLFWAKMYIIVPALIFTFTLRHKVTQADEGRVGPFWSKVVGLVSIGLWSAVAITSRLIGLLT